MRLKQIRGNWRLSILVVRSSCEHVVYFTIGTIKVFYVNLLALCIPLLRLDTSLYPTCEVQWSKRCSDSPETSFSPLSFFARRPRRTHRTRQASRCHGNIPNVTPQPGGRSFTILKSKAPRDVRWTNQIIPTFHHVAWTHHGPLCENGSVTSKPLITQPEIRTSSTLHKPLHHTVSLLHSRSQAALLPQRAFYLV